MIEPKYIAQTVVAIANDLENAVSEAAQPERASYTLLVVAAERAIRDLRRLETQIKD